MSASKFLGVTAAFLLTALPAVALPISLNDIPNLAQVDNNFYRGGMPSSEGLRELKAAGISTIVSLANEKKYLDAERTEAEQLGLRFVHIPLSAWRAPSQNDIDAFLSVVEKKDKEPVFVHCLHGEDRTGAMVALYRMDYDHWTEDRARDEMMDKGFHKVFVSLSNVVKSFPRKLLAAATAR